MNKLTYEFEGIVDTNEIVGDYNITGVTINGEDVIGEISSLQSAPVRVYLGVEPNSPSSSIVKTEGILGASHGWAGTDVTPGDLPEIYVGTYELLSRLNDYDGLYVVLAVEEL